MTRPRLDPATERAVTLGKGTVAVLEPVDVPDYEPVWTCWSCGNSKKGSFATVKYWTPYGYEYDCECLECGSVNTGEDGKPECQHCGNSGWWCAEHAEAVCEECWERFPAQEEPEERLCPDCRA